MFLSTFQLLGQAPPTTASPTAYHGGHRPRAHIRRVQSTCSCIGATIFASPVHERNPSRQTSLWASPQTDPRVQHNSKQLSARWLANQRPSQLSVSSLQEHRRNMGRRSFSKTPCSPAGRANSKTEAEFTPVGGDASSLASLEEAGIHSTRQSLDETDLLLDIQQEGEQDVWRWRRQLLGKVARFAGPALCIPLADPLMSLIDSVAVGRVRMETSRFRHR